MPDCLRLHYHLYCAPGEDPARKARDIALEQTAELPAHCVSDPILRDHVGTVERMEPLPDNGWSTVISYPIGLVGDELTQFLNLLFGNISLKDGMLIIRIDWPAALLERFGGPALGIDGLRELTSVPAGLPLTCTALKPMGSTSGALAALAREFALGGIDIIKDDHGLANQPEAPFIERLAACQAAVEEANRDSGGNTLYFPNVTAPMHLLGARLQSARDAGCRGVLLCPWITGLDSMRWARDTYGLAIIAHPALTGSYFGERHGLTPALLLGELFRVAGADASIYPNTGGRFGFSQATCEAINERLRDPLGALKPAMPAPGGGMDVRRAPHWIQAYGPDTMILIGGSLYERGDVARAARELMHALGR